MDGPHSPQTQVCEGACAIKVSMRCSDGRAPPYIPSAPAHGPSRLRAGRRWSASSADPPFASARGRDWVGRSTARWTLFTTFGVAKKNGCARRGLLTGPPITISREHSGGGYPLAVICLSCARHRRQHGDCVVSIIDTIVGLPDVATDGR